MALDVYKVRNVLFWIAVLILILIMAWYVFGSSPTLEQMSFIISILFIFLAWEERINANRLENKVDSINLKLDEMSKILQEINKNIKRR